MDISKVFTSGRYFVGPDFTFKVFQANAHFVKLDEISVWTDDKVEIEISCSFQYFLREDFLPDLHEAYNVDYEPVVKGTAIDAIKGRAADLPIDDYIRFDFLLIFSYWKEKLSLLCPLFDKYVNTKLTIRRLSCLGPASWAYYDTDFHPKLWACIDRPN